MSLSKSKKFLLGICFFVLFIFNAFGQVAGDYRTKASGVWSAFATVWERHNGTTFVAAVAAPTSADGVITIRAGHTITLGANTTVDQLVINNTGILSILTTRVLTINNGAGTDVQIDAGGALNCLTGSATLTINASANIINNGTLSQTVGTAIVNNNGIITNSGTITSTSSANFRFLAGSEYEHNFLSSVGTIPAATWNASSTCEVLACLGPGAGPSGIGQSFGHFIWDNTGQAAGDINLAGAFIGTQVGGNFTLKSTGAGRLVLKGTNAGGTAIGGNFSITGGSMVLTNGAVGVANSNLFVTVTGSYSQSGGTFILSENSGTSVSTNGSASMTIGTTTNITNGTLTLSNSPSTTSSQGNGTFTSTGAMTVSGGTINLSTSTGSGLGGTGSLNTSSTLTISGGTLNLCSSTRTLGGGSGTLTSTGLITLSGGTITGSSATTTGVTGCNSTIQANGGLTITSGILNLTPGNITGGGGTGFINVTGALAVSGGTLTVNSSTATLGTTGSNGTISVSTTCTFSGTALVNLTNSTTTGGGGSGTLNVTGAFSMTTGTFNLCSTSGTGTGDGLLDVGGNCSFTGGTFNITSSTTAAANTGKGTINIGGNFVHTTSAASFARTATSASATGTINIDGLTALQTIQSNSGFSGTGITFNINQGGVAAAITRIPAATTFIVNSGTTFNVNDNPTNITGNELQVVATGVLNVSGIMNVNADATLDLIGYAIVDASTGGGVFNLNSEGKLITRHAQGITTLASGATGCIRVTGGRTYNSSASYTYNGTAAQVTGNGLPTALTSLSILTINNTSAVTTLGVTLTQATSTSGTFTLTAGRFITSLATLFTINDDGISSSSGSISAFVDGPMKKIGDDIFIFPVGDVYTNTVPTLAAKWARIEIAAPTSVTDEFTAEYHKENDPHNFQVVGLVNGAGIDHVSHKEYWDLTRNAGTSTPHVKLYWADGAVGTSIGSAISSTSDLRVAEYYSGQWNDKGAGALTGTTASGTLFTGIIPDFTTGLLMNFTFSSALGVNPLPVELLSFTGTPLMNGNQLDWSTATETNNDYFDLERSSDGIEFIRITTIDGNGNSSSTNNYKFLDSNPFDGTNYYRLKQTDFNGEYFYSSIVSIQNTNSATVLVYPNPSKDIVTIDITDNFESLKIYNMLGELVYENSSNETKFQFNPISNGIYVVKGLTTEGKEITTRFIKN